MVDLFYTIKTNKGFINRNLYKDKTHNLAEAVKFYSLEDASEHKDMIKEELEPEVVGIKCEYMVISDLDRFKEIAKSNK